MKNPYGCGICGKHFLLPTALANHVETEHFPKQKLDLEKPRNSFENKAIMIKTEMIDIVENISTQIDPYVIQANHKTMEETNQNQGILEIIHMILVPDWHISDLFKFIYNFIESI